MVDFTRHNSYIYLKTKIKKKKFSIIRYFFAMEDYD